MPVVTNDDRIAAALLRIDYAERLISEAKKIFTYAETQQEGGQYEIPEPCQRTTDTMLQTDEDGLYPGQLPDPEKLIKHEDEEDALECLE